MGINPQQLSAAARARTTAHAARHGEISVAQAMRDVTEDSVAQARAADVDVCGLAPAVQGVGVSPGVTGGRAVFSVAEAVGTATPAILVLPESRPEDLPGLLAAAAVVTERGGRTSHAGVVARGLGRPAVTALRDASVDIEAGCLRPAVGPPILAGDQLTVDGRTGVVYRGVRDASPASATSAPPGDDPIDWLLDSAARLPAMEVRVNAYTGAAAGSGRDAGATGVGLCRVEHIFLGPRQLLLQRAMLASRGADSTEALDAVRTVLRAEFDAILRVMDGLPVAIRLLDPPRHEFLPAWPPHPRSTGNAGADGDEVAALRRLSERNPMLGVRGIRLGLLEPELTIVTLCALLEATAAARQAGAQPRPELIVPMVSAPAEVDAVACLLAEARELVGEPAGSPQIPLGS